MYDYDDYPSHPRYYGSAYGPSHYEVYRGEVYRGPIYYSGNDGRYQRYDNDHRYDRRYAPPRYVPPRYYRGNDGRLYPYQRLDDGRYYDKRYYDKRYYDKRYYDNRNYDNRRYVAPPKNYRDKSNIRYYRHDGPNYRNDRPSMQRIQPIQPMHGYTPDGRRY
ncbi:hypothetical protein D3880_16955 [Pseudomonas cavernae]|uniref:Uncharacterized protein n=1 Tax=Pseudomonas cavernae TaxID=2320867 RepID=A0A385Z486_9PSED|nr:hypothetical protein D3880_16955 [Pseudomonas cavernae]